MSEQGVLDRAIRQQKPKEKLMGKQAALEAAMAYAAKWGVSWGCLVSCERERAWWLLFATKWYTFTMDNGNGSAVVNVQWPGNRVYRFEYSPRDKGWMLPLWAAFPTFNSVTIGWRMGYGEDYKYRWHDWYRNLTAADRTEYKRRFPPPDHGAWPGFYDEIADRESSGTVVDHIIGRV